MASILVQTSHAGSWQAPSFATFSGFVRFEVARVRVAFFLRAMSVRFLDSGLFKRH